MDPFLDPPRAPKDTLNRPRDDPRGPQRPPKFKKSRLPEQFLSMCGFGAKNLTLFIDFYCFLEGPTPYSDRQAQCFQHIPQTHFSQIKTECSIHFVHQDASKIDPGRRQERVPKPLRYKNDEMSRNHTIYDVSSTSRHP